MHVAATPAQHAANYGVYGARRVYVAFVMDVFSRKIMGWQLPITCAPTCRWML